MYVFLIKNVVLIKVNIVYRNFFLIIELNNKYECVLY